MSTICAPLRRPARKTASICFSISRAAGAKDVPDPYYGGAEGFADVYRMIRVASEALAAKLGARGSTPASGQASSIT